MRWAIWKRNRHLRPEEVSEYLDGRLSGKDVRRVEAHIEACPDCRHEVESLRQIVLAVRRMPMRQPRRSFVFSAPPVAAPAPGRPEATPRAGSGAAVAVIARPRVPRWAFGAVASACAVAFAVVLSLDITGSFVASPSLAEQRGMYATDTALPAPAPVATPTPIPGMTSTEPPVFGAAAEGPDDKSASDQLPSTALPERARIPGREAASQAESSEMLRDIGTEQGTWWVWHLVEGMLGAVALVAGLAVLLRRRIPVLSR